MKHTRNGEINSMNEFVVRITKDGTDIEKEELVTRCIECKHCFNVNEDIRWCSNWDRETGLYEFCSFGEPVTADDISAESERHWG